MGPYYELAKVLGVEAGLICPYVQISSSGSSRSVVWSTADTARPPEGPRCAGVSSKGECANREGPVLATATQMWKPPTNTSWKKGASRPRGARARCRRNWGTSPTCLFFSRIVAYGQSVGRRAPQSPQLAEVVESRFCQT